MSLVPAIGVYSGGPFVRMRSAGSTLERTRGTPLIAVPGMCFRTSAQLPVAGRPAVIDSGSEAAAVHGPLSGSGEVSQESPSSR